MNLLSITSILIAAVVVTGAFLAAIIVWFSNVVTLERVASTKEKESYNSSVTLGHRIPIDVDPESQLKAAKKEAAKRAAAMPRGANMRIGQLSGDEQPTTYDGLDQDPISAVKIAMFHGWDGVRIGAKAEPQAKESVKPAAAAIASVKSADDLVPGVDYPYIETTDDMKPAEIRKARIANAKARAAAAKALKEQAAPDTPAPIKEAKTVVGKPGGITSAVPTREPVPGVDYEFIEITDDMDPAEARKARISNAKAKSAAMKRFKEAGGGTIQEETPTSSVSQQTLPANDEQKTDSQVLANISPPELIEITDDMDQSELRRARIHNAKAMSSYKKALKEAGIDPATVTL